MSLIALLCSPLLGPTAWKPVAGELRERGSDALVVVPGSVPPASASDALQGYVDALPTDTDLVLVPHSNAGLYVAAIAEQRRVSAAVYVDAGLPRPYDDAGAMVPPEFLAKLRSMADVSGVLPVWTQWWDEDDLASAFADAAVRKAVESEQQRLPLSYFEDSVRVPPGWTAIPSAYLGFGDTYASEIERARSLGWPTATLPGEHLEMTVHPRQVAETIIELLSRAR